MRTIDISGPKGNAFYLLGLAVDLGKQLEFDEEKRNNIQKEMTKGDYENLCEVFKNHFGMFFELVNGVDLDDEELYEDDDDGLFDEYE